MVDPFAEDFMLLLPLRAKTCMNTDSSESISAS